MAKVKNESKMKEFAIIGAKLRVGQLLAELNTIKKQFGTKILGLSVQSGGGTKREAGGVDVGNGRKKRRMSAAARKRISEAQKARWAKQKAASKK